MNGLTCIGSRIQHQFPLVYDELDRLTGSQRADDFDQSWGLDGVGNFSTFDEPGTSQTRTTNQANEIESISGTWANPVYDAAGNMISGPKTGDETTRLHYVYDARVPLLDKPAVPVLA
jgi:hypothetical protein